VHTPSVLDNITCFNNTRYRWLWGLTSYVKVVYNALVAQKVIFGHRLQEVANENEGDVGNNLHHFIRSLMMDHLGRNIRRT